METIMFTRQEFETWLKEQQPDVVVGQARQPTCCPIACYLNDFGGATVTVTESSIEDMDGNTIGTTAPWVTAFIEEVDEAPLAHPITAQDALYILASIPTE